jgi:hypothetical protein
VIGHQAQITTACVVIWQFPAVPTKNENAFKLSPAQSRKEQPYRSLPLLLLLRLLSPCGLSTLKTLLRRFVDDFFAGLRNLIGLDAVASCAWRAIGLCEPCMAMILTHRCDRL